MVYERSKVGGEGLVPNMKPEKLRAAAELIGIAAIVVSLIFVGLEVRQSAAATRGATQQALADSAREASEALVADERNAELAYGRAFTT